MDIGDILKTPVRSLQESSRQAKAGVILELGASAVILANVSRDGLDWSDIYDTSEITTIAGGVMILGIGLRYHSKFKQRRQRRTEP